MMAGRFDEMSLVRAAYGLEQALDLKERFPEM